VKEIISAIDLGTNSARLLIGFRDKEESIKPVLLMRHITRLGGGFKKETGISAMAGERTINALHDFADHMKRHGVTRYRAVATSAVREAVNGEKFVGDVFKKTGIALEIIDGTEEALLTLRGVISGLDDKRDDFLVFDVGGGSTEYTLAKGETPLFTMSLPLGVVRLTEGKGSCAAMDEKITRELMKVLADVDKAGLTGILEDATLVGTAGTATTLAAIRLKMEEYDYRRVNNYCLTLDDVKAIYLELLPMTLEERLKVPGLEKGREDLIIAGALITVRTMEIFGFRQLKVSDCGLLEGIMLSV
jgi:exopolyphosphatase/guanosine-5'-triphosphate,3'-diphosphate pyrophosphatase